MGFQLEKSGEIDNKRIEYIDILRGIAMILVLIGHNDTILTNYIYSFHIPLFFFISGLTYKGNSVSLKEVIKKRFRNIVIPYIKNEFNPNIIKTLNRLSEIIKEEDEYVQSETEKIFKEILLTDEKNKIEFDPRKFNEQEKVIQKNLILLAIKKVKGSTQGIEKVNIDDIIKLCNNNIGNKLIRPTKQLEIGIKNKRIYIKNII